MIKKKKISIIIPFFNEKYEIPFLINDIFKFEKKNPNQIYEYLFINDCSTDNSVEILINNISKKKFPKKKIRLIHNKKNLGWANSLRRGYKYSKGDYCLYIPGDGEAKLTKFMNIKLLKEEFDVLLIQRKAMKGRPLSRRIISNIYRILISILFLLKIRDYNGLIIVKKKKIKNLHLNSNSFFISAEIIVKAIKNKMKLNEEYFFSVETKKKYKSTSLSFYQFCLLIMDTIKTFYYLIFK